MLNKEKNRNNESFVRKWMHNNFQIKKEAVKFYNRKKETRKHSKKGKD